MLKKVFASFCISLSVLSLTVGGVARAYDGESALNCSNRSTLRAINLYSGSTYKGTMTVYNCSGNYYLRLTSPSKVTMSGSLTRYTPGGSYNGSQIIGSVYAYAAMSNMMSKRSGYTFVAYANIGGAIHRYTFTQYY
jgi:hypothetical protein